MHGCPPQTPPYREGPTAGLDIAQTPEIHQYRGLHVAFYVNDGARATFTSSDPTVLALSNPPRIQPGGKWTAIFDALDAGVAVVTARPARGRPATITSRVTISC